MNCHPERLFSGAKDLALSGTYLAFAPLLNPDPFVSLVSLCVLRVFRSEARD
jgi:hypothetical protein